jgi:cation transporter-like permease
MHAALVPAALTFGASLAIVSGARVASAFCLGALYGAKRSGDKPHQWVFDPAPVASAAVAAVLTAIFWIGTWIYHLL